MKISCGNRGEGITICLGFSLVRYIIMPAKIFSMNRIYSACCLRWQASNDSTICTIGDNPYVHNAGSLAAHVLIKSIQHEDQYIVIWSWHSSGGGY